MLLYVSSATQRINLTDLADGIDHLINGVDDEARLIICDGLRDSSSIERYYGCAARHSLKEHQAKRFIPANRH